MLHEELTKLLNNLTRLRKQNDLTKTEMANALHISTVTLNKIENGIMPKRLGANILIRASRYFSIPIEQLFS